MVTSRNKHCDSILIVDDMPGNIEVLQSILNPYYDLFAALNGNEAIRIAESLNPPDLILLDIMMPEIDGYQVCRKLKSRKKTKDIPVIFITAKSEVDDETRGFEIGGEDYITKPIHPAIVLARVRVHLELKRSREQLAKQNDELSEAARLKEDVDHIIRHDMKSPLTCIINTPDLIIMENQNLSTEELVYLKSVRDSGYRLLNMINLSTDLIKIERGTYKIQPSSIDILQLIRSISTELDSFARAKNISLQISTNSYKDSKPERVAVHGEQLLCYTMLANLIKNAIEASPEEQTVCITMEKKKTVEIIIHNQGAVPKTIRKSFFQKYVSYGKKYGTGLGTYSAKLMAEAQGGTIKLRTSESIGTKVIVQLPVGESCIKRDHAYS